MSTRATEPAQRIPFPDVVMDPALRELLASEAVADPDRMIEAIIRLARPGIEIPGVHVVARFGSIATCRIRAGDVVAVHQHDDVVSLKAARRLSPGTGWGAEGGDTRPVMTTTDIRRPEVSETGAGVVVGAVDWGVDIDALTFRAPAGNELGGGATRFLAIWDQRDTAADPRPEPYGYGTVHDRDSIDDALASRRPYERLGYHPAIADRGTGTHGTHVLDIAAGNGRSGGPSGMAPEADLVFVHLADRDTGGLANMGDSVRLLEAVNFIARTAGSRPCAINISAGRMGGQHDGTALVELAFDELLAATPGLFIVQSAGNYVQARTHACGVVISNKGRQLRFHSHPADATPNELEIWYDGGDELAVRIDPPGCTGSPWVRLGQQLDLMSGGRVVGRVYHRAHDPNNGDHHIDAFLYPAGAAGTWTVTLQGIKVSDGRFHAWLERDELCRRCQARFARTDADRRSTIGTIANSRLPLVVGAYDGRHQTGHPAPFSSAGPTRDGRPKPDLAAPGVEILAARSAPAGTTASTGQLVRKSGTSMATPQVTGAVALCLEIAGHRLDARALRELVLATCDPPRTPDPERRLGRGHLNVSRLLAATRRSLAPPQPNASARHPISPPDLPPPGTADLSPKEPIVDIADATATIIADPATAYRELLYRPAGELARSLSDRCAIVARPGQRLDQAPRAGDLLVEVALGHRRAGWCVRLDGPTLDAVRPGCQLRHGQVLLRPVTGSALTWPPDSPSADPPPLAAVPRSDPGALTVLEQPWPPAASEDLDTEAAACVPAPEPDPTGRSLHPLVTNGSRRPVVGHAQTCLNNWMARYLAGEPCVDLAPATRTFVDTTLADLAARGQRPLVVDCRFGTSTAKATRAFQACKGLTRDAKIGRNTWALLAPYISGGAPAPAAGYNLLVDAARTGALAPAPATWTWGPSGSGAVVLVNNDDDGANGTPDNEDATVDTGNDITELSPLVLELAGPVPAGVTVDLRVSDPGRLRILQAAAPGAPELVGPTRGPTHQLTGLATNRVELAMEGIRYPEQGFTGEVTVTAATTMPGGATSTSSTMVRLAPWIVPHHLHPTEKVFVADAGSLNDRFRTELRAMVASAGAALVERSIPHGDVWVQDVMELGYASVPSKTLRTVLRAPRTRPLAGMARSLLNTDLGFVTIGGDVPSASEDSTGNLEATPPATSAAGKNYPLGRIYYSVGNPLSPIDPELRAFLQAQVVQEPIELDLSWMTVGHVDEVISFVAAPTPKGFKLVLASPRRAYDILDRTPPATPMLVGRSFPSDSGPAVTVERSVGDFLTLDDDFHPDLRANNPTYTARRLRAYNRDRDLDMTRVRTTMTAALGLTPSDIVELPVVFMPNPKLPSVADAMTGNVVNMLVTNGHCIVPKPFGPTTGAVDAFEQDVSSQLTPLGATVKFLDCWFEYHIALGSVHCATNSLRQAPPARWWEQTP